MEELAPERQAIKAALDTLKVDGWVFEEDAGARATSIQQTYLQEIEDADLYVGLFWIGIGEYTIGEYEHAQKLGKDCLIYEKRSNIDENRDPKLQSFLDKLGRVETGQTIQWFETNEELRELIQQDIARWQTSKIRERQSPIDPLAEEAVRAVTKIAEEKERTKRGQIYFSACSRTYRETSPSYLLENKSVPLFIHIHYYLKKPKGSECFDQEPAT
ncbi:MAG: hypothetical protein JKY86_13495 [Gammaproteobacteria bacterium]|nr:hypothetical protein [Gammaproteobacteria bacterium]